MNVLLKESLVTAVYLRPIDRTIIVFAQRVHLAGLLFAVN
jgi:hypothetical protein